MRIKEGAHQRLYGCAVVGAATLTHSDSPIAALADETLGGGLEL